MEDCEDAKERRKELRLGIPIALESAVLGPGVLVALPLGCNGGLCSRRMLLPAFFACRLIHDRALLVRNQPFPPTAAESWVVLVSGTLSVVPRVCRLLC